MYLYDCGYFPEISYEIKTSAWFSLIDYAMVNPEKVFLYDIYRVISELQFQVFNYFLVEKNQGQYLGRYVNLCYYVKDRTQVYTNLQKWEAFSEEKIQNMLESFPIYVSYTWKNGKLLADYCSETVAGYWLSSYLVLNQIFFGNKSIYTGLDTASPIDDKEVTKVYDSLDPEILTTAIIGLIIMVAAFVFCSFQVGRNQKNETLWLYGFDFLHTEVAMAVWVLLDIFLIVYFGYVINMSDMSEFFMVFLGFYFCVSVGLFMLFYLRFMRKIKLHNLWGKNILCAAIHPRGRFGETKTFPKLIIAIFGLMLLHFICFLITEFFGIMLCLVVDILVLLYIFREVGEKRRVIEGLCQMGSGNIDYKVDTTKLKGNNKELAEMVNSMGDSLKRAMAVRIQNERLQADLIVSISHDIKTPLTSIINYVDLLKRENIEDSKIKGYIDILEGKSQRLKQLTENLLEASKVSSGNINMKFVILNLNELVKQMNGEFNERLSDRKLNMICNLLPEPVLVRADSQYLWRVIENLYGNVAQYAMPGSKVYVDIIRKEGDVVFIMKNMSEQTLNINPDKLVKEFVRGDSSKIIKGSGLGLLIVENLVKLMNGRFKLFVESDFFKVEVTFPEEKSRFNGLY
ncbi:MAG: HAMP domain-containing histidine kinase [Lachnospiraceae bacterium]|nr:HAMP domain-containing histidine kinase [Lachnospiraceae bacterium]